jgi:hypothetical protein
LKSQCWRLRLGGLVGVSVCNDISFNCRFGAVCFRNLAAGRPCSMARQGTREWPRTFVRAKCQRQDHCRESSRGDYQCVSHANSLRTPKSALVLVILLRSVSRRLWSGVVVNSLVVSGGYWTDSREFFMFPGPGGVMSAYPRLRRLSEAQPAQVHRSTYSSEPGLALPEYLA